MTTISPMTTKTNKYEWLYRFNDDLLQHKTRFTNKIPALCFTKDEAFDNSELQKKAPLIEKWSLFDGSRLRGNSLRRKYYFSNHSYYKTHQYEQNPPDPTVVKQSIEYLLFTWHCTLLFDNQLLDLLNEHDYRCLIVDGSQDYFNNYYESIKQPDDNIFGCCFVLVKPDGSYFYALPLKMGDVWEELLLSNKIAPNIYLSPTTEIPIIETTVLNVNELLNQVPLTKIIDGEHLVRNNTDNHSLFKYIGTLNTNYLAKFADKKKNGYQYLFLNTTANLFTYNRLFVNNYTNHILQASIGTDGNMHYQFNFDQTEPTLTLSKFWQELIKQPKTQNLNHFLKCTNTVSYQDFLYNPLYTEYLSHDINKAPINKTAIQSVLKFDWSHFGTQNVEDVPVETKHSIVKPLAKPSGLNQILGLLQDHNKYHYFIINNKLILLKRSDMSKKIIVQLVDW